MFQLHLGRFFLPTGMSDLDLPRSEDAEFTRFLQTHVVAYPKELADSVGFSGSFLMVQVTDHRQATAHHEESEIHHIS